MYAMSAGKGSEKATLARNQGGVAPFSRTLRGKMFTEGWFAVKNRGGEGGWGMRAKVAFLCHMFLMYDPPPMNRKEWLWHRTLIDMARELRKNMTPAEKILWRALRDRRFRNFKFRRQVPIERFIVDFLCMQHRLVIELDGGIHDTQKEYDEEREEYLEHMNYKIIRFRNEEVFDDLPSVLEKIENAVYKTA